MPVFLRTRWFALLVFGGCAVGLLAWFGRSKFDRHGDAWEYFATLEAIDRHGTFDIRPGDREATFDEVYRRYRRPLAETHPPEAQAAATGGWVLVPKSHGNLDMYAGELKNGFVVAPDGRTHPLHFWMYSLAAYPAKVLLRAVGAWEFNALKVTNAALFMWAIGVVLFRAAGSVWRRVLFAGLAAVNPVVWYLPFTGAEVFSWAFATVAMVGLDTRRYARSALAAGLAATQNPPLILLAAVPVLCALWERRWRSAALAVVGAAVGLLPVAYYLYHFNKPSLISGTHVSPALISTGRTLCLLFDLNVGLLPYVPVLLLASALAMPVLLLKRDGRAVLTTLAVVGMMLGVQVQVNWNSDCRGLLRYLVWMLPPLAWLIAVGFNGRWRTGVALASAGVSGLILAIDFPSDGNYLEQRPVARFVLTHAPRWYNPEFEIFAERQAHGEDLPFEAVPGAKQVALPIAFGTADGAVTKLLLHRESAARLGERFTIDPAYLPELLRIAAEHERPVYVHPPAGAVRAPAGTIDGTFAAWPELRP